METLFLTLILGVDHYLPLAAVLSKLDDFAHNRKILMFHMVIDGETGRLRPMTVAERQILEVHASVVATRLSGSNGKIDVDDLLQITAESQHAEQPPGHIFLGNWAKDERFVFVKAKWPLTVGSVAVNKMGQVLRNYRPHFAQANHVFPKAPWPETFAQS